MIPPRASEPAPRARGIGTVVLVLVLFASALALRLSGVDFLLPTTVQNDERVYLSQLELLQGNTSDARVRENARFYPDLIARVATLWPAPYQVPRTLEEHVANASAPALHLRVIVSFLSALSVIGTWMLARRFGDRRVAFLAAAIVATSFLDVSFAQQARPHSALAAPLLTATLAALWIRAWGGIGSYVAFGVAGAIAAGVLQSGPVVIGALGVAHFLRSRARIDSPASQIVLAPLRGAEASNSSQPRRARRRAVDWVMLALAIALVAASVLAFTSLSFRSKDASTEEVLLSGHSFFPTELNGRGFAVVVESMLDYEPWLLVLLAIALGVTVVRAWRRRRERGATRDDASRTRRAELWVVLGGSLPYLAAIGLYERSAQRFLIPLVPFAAVFVAWAVQWIGDALSTRVATGARQRMLALVPAALVLALQARSIADLCRVRATPDTQKQAAAWIRERAPAGTERIGVFSNFDLPLMRDAASLRAARPVSDDVEFPWLRYQRRLDDAARAGLCDQLVHLPLESDAQRELAARDPEAWLDTLDVDLIVLEVWAEGRPVLASVREGAKRSRELLARFAPFDEGIDRDRPLLHQETYYALPRHEPWHAVVRRARATGAVIEIYAAHSRRSR